MFRHRLSPDPHIANARTRSKRASVRGALLKRSAIMDSARVLAVGLGGLLSLGGCAGTTPKVDNPVLGAAPPRKPGAVVAEAGNSADPAVVNVSFESDSNDAGEWNEVAGRVDGLPIFTRDVLEADRPKLQQLKAQAPPDVYREQRRKLLKARLPQYIEQRLLLAAVKDELTGEQLEAVDEQLGKMFDQEIERLKKITKSRTLNDLEDVLATQGTSLAALRQAFNDRQMAGQFLGLKLQNVEPPSRPEILAEYESRREDYLQPEDVRWQQLWISYSTHGGREGAFDVLRQAAADLKSGESFDVVIGRYSDGPMKDKGGVWDYAQRGSLSSKEVEDALFTLPVGEVSRPYDVGNAFQIVRVADRRSERVVPLADVQDKLAEELGTKRQNKAAAKIVGGLWRAAAIETNFDDDPEWQKLIRERYEVAESADET